MFEEFKNKYLGKSVDIDGLYGEQCVDLFNAWNRDYNKTYINCRPSGFARSLAENKENNGILKYFTEVALKDCVPGTVIVYGRCKFAPDSHVCFFIKDNGNGTFEALQQNYHSIRHVTINNNPYSGIIGCFVPKQIKDSIMESKSEPLKENKVYETLGNMYVRATPNYNGRVKLVKELTEDGKKNATSKNLNAQAIYKKGTRYTCYEVITESDGRKWARTPSGYVCMEGASGIKYAKEV